MSALLLQKPNPRSKAKDHVISLERRLNLWLNGNVKELLEAHTIQCRLTQTKQKQQDDSASTSAKPMLERNARAALRIVTETNSGGTLQLDRVTDPESSHPKTVRDALLKKHPPKQPPTLINPNKPPTEPHAVIFEAKDGQIIRNTVLKMDGAASPSGLNVTAWKRMYTSFKSASADLCDSVASIARRLCSEYVDPSNTC